MDSLGGESFLTEARPFPFLPPPSLLRRFEDLTEKPLQTWRGGDEFCHVFLFSNSSCFIPQQSFYIEMSLCRVKTSSPFLSEQVDRIQKENFTQVTPFHHNTHELFLSSQVYCPISSSFFPLPFKCFN